MENLKVLNDALTELLQLDTKIVAVKRLDNKEALKDIPGIEKPKAAFTQCQIPHLVRREGKTIGITYDDATPLAEKMQLGYRCLRIQGLAPADEKQINKESKGFAGFWYSDEQTAKKALSSYPEVPAIEALAYSPLEEEKFSPDYVLIYANGAQMTFLMNGYQYFTGEKIDGDFSGEGSCADALPRSVVTGKPSLCLPCVGERGFGLVNNDEMMIAIPAEKLATTVKGLQTLKENGLAYPVGPFGEGGMDVAPLFEAWYPIQE